MKAQEIHKTRQEYFENQNPIKLKRKSFSNVLIKKIRTQQQKLLLVTHITWCFKVISIFAKSLFRNNNNNKLNSSSLTK